MPDVSTSGPINGQFLSADEVQTSYVPVASRGFNQLVKTQRQGRWFLLKGNLQYQATTKTWRFADQQYHVIGMDNEKISETYSGWIDLFGPSRRRLLGTTRSRRGMIPPPDFAEGL